MKGISAGKFMEKKEIQRNDFPEYTKCIESREHCAESGWYAFDFMLTGPMSEAYIGKLKKIGGSFLFLTMLKKPFFKLEAENYIIKGVLGNDFFRMAVQDDAKAELSRVEKYLVELCTNQKK